MSTKIFINDEDNSHFDIFGRINLNKKVGNDKLKHILNKTEFHKNGKLIQKFNAFSTDKVNGDKKLIQKNPFIIEKNNINNKTNQENIKKIENKTKNNKNKILIKKEKNNIHNISSKIENNDKNKILNQKRNRIEKEKNFYEINKTKNSESENEYSSSSSFSSSSESENSSYSLISSESEKQNNKKKTNRNKNYNIQKPKTKSMLVYELLKRWWYALPKWIPDNYDCSDKLKENKLRLVNIIDWKKEPTYDKNNYEKCIELPGFKYVFCNSNGDIFDFRPEEIKPSFNSLMKLSENKLYEYIINALKDQIKNLKKENGFYNKKLIEELNDELKKNEIIYNLIKNQ